MNLLQTFRRGTTTPPPIQVSRRDQLAEEISFEQDDLATLERQVRMGRRPQEDLDAQHERIADLQSKLQALDLEEAQVKQVQDACRTELPAAEAALAAEVQGFVNDLLRLQAKARTIHEQRTEIIDKCADFRRRQQRGQISVPMKNRELLALSGEAGFVGALTDPFGALMLFLKAAREAGFTVPQAEPAKRTPARQRPTPQAEPMSPQERRVRKATGSL